MADRVSRSVLEFVTKGDEQAVGAFDKVGRASKESTAAVSSFAGGMKDLSIAFKGFMALAVTQRVIQFGQAIFDSAGQILDLSNKTGLATDTIQQMQNVANQTGSSLETFTGAAFKLGINLSEGTKRTREAVAGLGLAYGEIKAMRPDDQFRAIIAALEGMESQTERNRYGQVLFGKQWAEIAASVQEGYTDIANAARLTSEQQLQALDQMGDAWQQFSDDLKSGARSTAGALVLYFREAYAAATLDRSNYTEAERSRISDALGSNEIGELSRVLDEIARARKTDIELTNDQSAASADFSSELAEAQQELRGLDAAQRANLDAAIRMGKTYEEVGRRVEVSEGAFNLYKKRLQEATQEATRHGVEQEKLAKQARDYYNWLGEREIAAAGAAQTRLDREQAAWREYYNWLGERRMENEAAEMATHQRLAQSVAQMFASMMASGSTWNGTGLGMLRPTVPMNAPGDTGQGFWGRLFGAGGDNRWAQMLGSGLGLLSGLLPGQSRLGSGIGSVAGSLFGPLGSALGGLAGGLIGRLFGGGEGAETRKRRNEWIEEVGGLDNLKSMAAAAGVSLDKLFATKKVKDFEAEAKRVMAAIEAHQQKVATLQAELNDLEAERARLTEETTVGWDKMRAQAEKFGINQEGLGQGFQQGRLNASAAEIIEALEVFKRGDANMGTVLFGMRDEISALVRESAEFGTTIPENLRPFIEHLMETGNLLDENGDALKELPTIKFGDAMASQLEKASDRLAEVVDKIADILSQLATLDGKSIDFTVTGDYRERGDGDGYGVWRETAGNAQPSMAASLTFARPAFSGASFDGAMGMASSTPLSMTLDGQVVAKAVIRRTGRTLALVGA